MRGTSQVDQGDPDDYTEVDWAPTGDAGKADVVGIPETFNRNHIMNDALFTDTETITADDVQWFFENSPYNGGGRSWLASEQVEGQPLSTVLYNAARERGLNPILLLARMQIEKGLVSKARPSQTQVNFRPASKSDRWQTHADSRLRGLPALRGAFTD